MSPDAVFEMMNLYIKIGVVDEEDIRGSMYLFGRHPLGYAPQSDTF